MPADGHFEAAGIRAEIYSALAELTTYPSDMLVEKLETNQLNEHLASWLGTLQHDFKPLAPAPPDNVGQEYLRLFDLSDCPLYGGVYGDDRKGVMEELTRLYRLFGLSISHAEIRDLPDSIPTVLEFLAWLCLIEARATDIGSAASARLAQRDLLSRHLTRWTAVIRGKAERLAPSPFYRDMLNLLHGFCVRELAALP